MIAKTIIRNAIENSTVFIKLLILIARKMVNLHTYSSIVYTHKNQI